MERLTIKELAPYLPYELKLLYQDDICYLDGISSDSLSVVTADGGEYVNIIHVKPIVRPLSQLTEEIEHKGEKFVPIIELAKMFHIHSKYIVTNYGDIKDYGYVGIKVNCYVENSNSRYSEFSIHSDELILHNDYRIVQKLLEWHFDVFGLIDRGLDLPIDGKEVEG